VCLGKSGGLRRLVVSHSRRPEVMKAHRQFRRALAALAISVAFHLVLSAVALAIDVRPQVLEILSMPLIPADALVSWLVPGHFAFKQLLLMFLFSTLTYAVVVWIALNLWAWLRPHPPNLGGPMRANVNYPLHLRENLPCRRRYRCATWLQRCASHGREITGA
jgi:hypothetical protein